MKSYYTVLSDNDINEAVNSFGIDGVTLTKSIVGAIDLLNVCQKLDVAIYLDEEKVIYPYKIYKLEEVDYCKIISEHEDKADIEN